MPIRLPTRRSRKPPARIWKVPKNILNLESTFSVDAHIKKLSERVRWTTTPAPSLARLALKNAILRASAEVEHQAHRWIAYNKRVAASAMRAQEEIDRTFKALVPRATSADMLVGPILDTRTTKGPQKLKSLRESSYSDANILWRSRVVLRQISEDAKRRQKAIAQVRQNPGDPEKRVFVLALAELWCTLFRKKPPLSPENNPFLDFVRAAWIDAGQDSEENFSRALRSARKSITDVVAQPILGGLHHRYARISFPEATTIAVAGKILVAAAYVAAAALAAVYAAAAAVAVAAAASALRPVRPRPWGSVHLCSR
jgi:hypothetical protein